MDNMTWYLFPSVFSLFKFSSGFKISEIVLLMAVTNTGYTVLSALLT